MVSILSIEYPALLCDTRGSVIFLNSLLLLLSPTLSMGESGRLSDRTLLSGHLIFTPLNSISPISSGDNILRIRGYSDPLGPGMRVILLTVLLYSSTFVVSLVIVISLLVVLLKL